MKNTSILKALFLVCAVLVFRPKAKAQSAEVAIGGDVAKPFKVNAAALKSMKSITVKVTDHDGKQHVYKGVPLFDLLTKAQALPNNQLKGKALTKYVLISAADGYQVVIALPEIDPAFTDQTIILANKADGKDLPPNLGPFRLIVPRDKKLARSVRSVTNIDVLTAKK